MVIGMYTVYKSSHKSVSLVDLPIEYIVEFNIEYQNLRWGHYTYTLKDYGLPENIQLTSYSI